MALGDIRVLGLVMAGGEGRRLLPLTLERSKPAVPFGGSFRIVDFVLSNFLNSGLYSVYVLVQYRSQSLIDHLREAWRLSTPRSDDFLTVVPPQMRLGREWYRGTADAVYQNSNLIYDFRPDLIAVFGADHVYRMHVGQMIEFHRERKAEMTVAMLPVRREEASGFGVAEMERSGRVVGWQEKVADPPEIPGRSGWCLASMGNYLFEPSALVEVLREVNERGLEPDFGKTIVPLMLEAERYRVYAYDFLRNDVPGVRPHEERGYWRDVGTLEAYWAAHMDILGREPRFDLNNPRWPIHTVPLERQSARLISGSMENSTIGVGSTLAGGRLVRSVVGRNVLVEEGAEIVDSIVMDNSRISRGARLHRAIVDRYNLIEEGEVVAPGEPTERQDARVEAGLIALPRGRTRPMSSARA